MATTKNWAQLENAFCGGCYWWDEGLCRQRAPEAGKGWPATTEDDWCGSYADISAVQAIRNETGIDPTLRHVLEQSPGGMERKDLISAMLEAEPGLRPLAARMRITRNIKANRLELYAGGCVALAEAESEPNPKDLWQDMSGCVMAYIQQGKNRRTHLAKGLHGSHAISYSSASGLFDAWTELGYLSRSPTGEFSRGPRSPAPRNDESRAPKPRPVTAEPPPKPRANDDEIREQNGAHLRNQGAFEHGPMTPTHLQTTAGLTTTSPEQFEAIVCDWIRLGLVVRLPDGTLNAGARLQEKPRPVAPEQPTIASETFEIEGGAQ